MLRKAFFLIWMAGMVWAPLAFAAISTATADQCTAMVASGIKRQGECVPGETIIDSATEALIHASKGANSPAAFLEENACKETNIACLDPQFAFIVQRFYEAGVEASKQQGFTMPHITDGWRSPAAQAVALATGASHVGPCGSPHNYGIAVDFNDGNDKAALKWMRANANFYGLETIGDEVSGCSGNFCDPAHFQIKGWKNRSVARGQCITGCNAPPSGKVQSCTGGGANLGGGIMSSIGDAFSQLTQPLSNLFNSKPAQPPITPALPSTNTGVEDTFGTTTFPTNINTNINSNTNVPTNNSTVSNTSSATPEEQLAEIAVGPKAATGTSTPQHPLTDEEFRLLQEQRAHSLTNSASQNALESPSGIQPLAVPPFAGFIPTENLNQQASNEFLQYYVQTLTRVALAIAEILRIMRGEPQSGPDSSAWLTE